MLAVTGCIESYVESKISGEDITGDIVLDLANETADQDICQEGYRECGKACIKEEDCCNDGDCNAGEACYDFECTSLKPGFCAFHMAWDAEKGECACEEGTKWCDYQDKCIPELKCCSRFECSRRGAEYCAPTYVSIRMCVENGEKSCKYISEMQNEKKFVVSGENFNVLFEDYFEGEVIDLVVNDDSFLKVKKAQRISSGNATLFFDDFKELGGACQDYD